MRILIEKSSALQTNHSFAAGYSGHGIGVSSLKARAYRKLHLFSERYFSEQRLYLRSDASTRFLRLTPATQMTIAAATLALFGWTVFATSAFLISKVSLGSGHNQTRSLQLDYEAQLDRLSAERDKRALEARKAQERFYVALEQISGQQSALLASEDRRRELETGIEVIQRTLRNTMKDRDRAQSQSDKLLAELQSVTGTVSTASGAAEETGITLDFLNAALARTVTQRDGMISDSEKLQRALDELNFQAKLAEEKNERIFSRLEEAVTVSMGPLEKMFESIGLSTDKLLGEVKSGYSGIGGPLSPLSVSTRGEPEDATSFKVNQLLEDLDNVNLMRILAESTPFTLPVKSSYRLTSPYGPRIHPVTGKRSVHEALDMAAPYGTPVYATANGVISFAGWAGSYGRVIKIRHPNGFETRYAHLQKIRVEKGQRVSQGERIGDMGSSGRSTGSHVHYEIRIDGKSTNPSEYFKAARNVF
jgi:murein DD-endopeptidase MepM/ murein hydrolase activator NlpD